MPKQQSVDPNLLKPNDWNTNHVSPDNHEKLVESIRQFGLFKPIVVREMDNGELQIIGGEHRCLAAIDAGLTSVEIFNLGKITDETAKKIGIADNQRYGADDMLSLSNLMQELGDAEYFQEFLPYTDADVKAIFASSTIALDDLALNLDSEEKSEEDPEEPEEPKSAAAPKTHTVMRFKVSLIDAERLTEIIADTKRSQGFTAGDDLLNAGDALVHLLIGATKAP